MTTVKQTIRALLLVFILTAGSSQAANEWHNNVLVAKIYAQGEGHLMINFSPTAASCTNGGDWHTVQVGQNTVTAEGMKMIALVAVTAMALGRNVRALFNNSSSNCYIAEMILQ